jgi:ribosomal protein S21|tara:strand:- start:1188 stop:1475 length:288 start_codon:yes stop_codon:yes gene_type:complete
LRKRRNNHNRAGGRYNSYDRTPEGKRPSHVSVRPRKDEHPERLIKRFLKKVKKEKVIDLYRKRTEYYEKPSIVKSRNKKRRKMILKKLRDSLNNN